MSGSEPDEDRALVERCLAAPEGDTRAFEALVQRHTGKVVANCRYITRSADDAEDLAQDVFVKAYFGLRRFEHRSSFRTWLHRIKVNRCLNHLKKMGGHTEVDLDGVATDPPEELRTEPAAQREIEAEGRRARIDQVLDSMSDTLRIPLILRDMDEMAYEEIAEALGIGLSAVKMRIKRAREEFRRRYAAPAETAEGPRARP